MTDIRIQNLTKSFGSTIALDNISLYVASGELFFLLGPSGCGKTTLLRSIAGFYTPNEGQISFGGHDVTKLPPHRRKVGMVFQNYALWPHMTVFQNVAFGLENNKTPKAKIKDLVYEILGKVQLTQYVSRKPNELSGGQQQRVALARALVVHPKCLLLDEPLSNLDAQLRNDMRCEIRNICKEHQVTTVYVTHDQKEALSIADRIAVFSKGKVDQIGTPTQLYKFPSSRFTAEFVGETNVFQGVIVQIGSGEAIIRTKIGNFRGILSAGINDPRPGKKVYISIRPECFRLNDFPSQENSVRGVIGNVTYFGEVAHFKFERDGVVLRISELNPSHFTNVQNKSMYATVSSEDVVILDVD
ncbi:MAG: ABC transporter ATP-binding protein [Puniceicoccales bacterium]|jgi:iron(III) transport system ATP-binding protein|nr:ABC transporter ATP-binding protein [Puniceicoccales bacterium]